MGEYHRISGMMSEQAGLADWLNPALDEGQRRSLKALSSLRAAIRPPADLWAALLDQGAAGTMIQYVLENVRKSIRLAERAVRGRDEDALDIQSESIRSGLAGIAKFLSMARHLSAHSVLQEYAGSISIGLRSLAAA